MDRARRDGQGFAALVDGRRTLDLVLERPFEDVDELFAWMCVPDRRRVRGEIDAGLDDLAARDAQILTLEIRPCDPGRLLHRHSVTSSCSRALATGAIGTPSEPLR